MTPVPRFARVPAPLVALRWGMLALLFALLAIPVAVPTLTGDQWIVVKGGSMTPVLQIGDVIVVDPHGPTGVGDVVTVRHPDSSLVTHRIIGEDHDGSFLLRGDANTVTDPDPVARSEVVGKVTAVISSPWSTMLRACTSTVGRVTLIGAILLLLFTPSVLARSDNRGQTEGMNRESRRGRSRSRFSSST
ncbi:signal peptidase I [uncultured Microbacterium sp.]|uniref:signal peptidase I n=1 Tax=uncultured Microbacterium sp. TaxID=191216 RepID=UPI0025E4B722|nr:signal peptidase I [uncultured Microbacterium sp.]